MAGKIWDSTSNNKIMVGSMAKGLDRHRVRQNIAYLVFEVFRESKLYVYHARTSSSQTDRRTDGHATYRGTNYRTLYVPWLVAECLPLDQANSSPPLHLWNASRHYRGGKLPRKKPTFIF